MLSPNEEMGNNTDSTRTPIPQLSPVEVSDRLAIMRKQEDSAYRCSDYVTSFRNSGTGQTPNQQQQFMPVDEDCRVKMCEWCYQVIDFCKLRRETVSISMSFLDRYASASRSAVLDRRKYQLAAMTSLYVAIKIFEPPLPISVLSDLSRGVYSEEEISKMEVEILFALNWRVAGPTVLSFIYHMIALLPPSVSKNESSVSKLIDFSQFQAELAVGDCFFMTQRASSVALAAVMNSMGVIDESAFLFPLRYQFLKSISTASNVVPFLGEIDILRSKLHDVFLKSSGHALPSNYDLKLIDYTSYELGISRAKEENDVMDTSCNISAN